MAPTSAPTAPTALPTVSPSSKAPTLAPSYLAGSPTANPSIAPTASPTAKMVTCTQNGGNGCCDLCGSSPCTMSFSSSVTYIGNSYSYWILSTLMLQINCYLYPGWSAFQSCRSLVAVIIPDKVTEIQSQSFYGNIARLTPSYLQYLTTTIKIM